MRNGIFTLVPIPVPAPAIPGNVQATRTLTQQVRVTWNAASRATSYEVWRRASTAGASVRVATTASTRFSDVGAVVGTTYYYWVRARNSSVLGGFSSRATGRRLPLPRPVVPAGVAATRNMTQQIRLTWGAASRATSYEVWRRASTSGTSVRVATTASTRYSDVGAVAGTTYYYWVRARNSSGASGFSARVMGQRAPLATLSSGQLRGISGVSGSQRFYRIYVPAGSSRLNVRTWGGSGDADLYVRYGGLPSTALHNGRSTSVNNDDTVALNNPAAGWWYIMVRGHSAFSGAYIRATVTTALRNGVAVISGGENVDKEPTR